MIYLCATFSPVNAVSKTSCNTFNFNMSHTHNSIKLSLYNFQTSIFQFMSSFTISVWTGWTLEDISQCIHQLMIFCFFKFLQFNSKIPHNICHLRHMFWTFLLARIIDEQRLLFVLIIETLSCYLLHGSLIVIANVSLSLT